MVVFFGADKVSGSGSGDAGGCASGEAGEICKPFCGNLFGDGLRGCGVGGMSCDGKRFGEIKSAASEAQTAVAD